MKQLRKERSHRKLSNAQKRDRARKAAQAQDDYDEPSDERD